MLKVLIVDDEPMILNGIISIIKREETLSCHIESANDAIEALSLLDSFPPDLIITDIHMPEMNGFEFIEQVKSRDLCNRFIILTGYDDFEYARKAIRYQAIDYLLKPVNKQELISLVHQISESMEEEVHVRRKAGLRKIREMILNRVTQDEVMLEDVEVNALFPSRWFTLVTIQPIGLLNDALVEQLGLILSRLPYLKYIFESRYSNLTHVLFNTEEPLDQDELKTIGKVLSNPQEYYLGVSDSRKGIEEIDQLYIQSAYEIFIGRHFADYRETETISYMEHRAAIDAMQNLFRFTHEYDLKQQIHLFISKMMDSGAERRTFADLRKLHIHILFHLDLYLKGYGLSLEQTAANGLLQEGAVTAHRQSLEASLLTTIMQIMMMTKMVSPSDIHSLSNPIYKVLRYIHNNYIEDISLDALAETLDLHPNYISTLFKKETGSTFIQYLHSYRIDKAKEHIMQTPSVSMEKIAASVGYPNPSHFFKVFKKYTGVTPGQFRENHL
jgi:two-component system response regulator YesN